MDLGGEERLDPRRRTGRECYVDIPPIVRSVRRDRPPTIPCGWYGFLSISSVPDSRNRFWSWRAAKSAMRISRFGALANVPGRTGKLKPGLRGHHRIRARVAAVGGTITPGSQADRRGGSPGEQGNGNPRGVSTPAPMPRIPTWPPM